MPSYFFPGPMRFKMYCTVNPVPLIIGFPTIILGFNVIRSSSWFCSIFISIYIVSHSCYIKAMAYNVLQIEEVAEGNFGKSLISLLSAVRRCLGTFLLGNLYYYLCDKSFHDFFCFKDFFSKCLYVEFDCRFYIL